MPIIELSPPTQDDPLTGELGFFDNPDGTRSTERSFTEEFDGRFFNFPSLVKGQVNPEAIARGERITDEQLGIAIDRFRERGGFNKTKGFDTKTEAIDAAKARSNAGGSTDKFQQTGIIELTPPTTTTPLEAPEGAIQAVSDLPIDGLGEDGKIPPAPTGEDPGLLGTIFQSLGEGFTRAKQGIQQKLLEAERFQAESGQGGFLGFDPGNVLDDIEVETDQIIKAAEDLKAFKAKTVEERQKFDESVAGSSKTGKAFVFLGETLPTLAVPGGVQGKIAKRILTGAISGTVIGGAQFTEGDTALGAGIGGTIGGAVPVIGSVFKKVAPLLGKKTAEIIRKAGGDELLQSTLKRLNSAKRLGLDLTPAEATGSGVLGKVQGAVGLSEKGAKLFETAGKKRIRDEQSAIGSFLYDLSPEGSATNVSIRNTARKILKDEQKILADAARPLYKASEGIQIPDQAMQELMKDPIIKSAYKQVLSDPVFQKELKDSSMNSIHMLDIVKRRMDDMVEAETNQFKEVTNRGRIITQSIRELRDVGDVVSPIWKEARGIYSADSPAVDALKGGVVGRIAKMNDSQIKGVSKVLFDTAQTDISVIAKMGARFAKEDPAAWRKVIRNEMERRLDQVGADRTATSFFDQILKKDRDFRLFLAATKGMPGTRKALVDMRRAFKDLIPPSLSAKGAAFRQAEGLSDPRNPFTAVLKFFSEIGLDKRDAALSEIITNPRWHDELASALKEGTKGDRVDKLLALIGKASAGAVPREVNP